MNLIILNNQYYRILYFYIPYLFLFLILFIYGHLFFAWCPKINPWRMALPTDLVVQPLQFLYVFVFVVGILHMSGRVAVVAFPQISKIQNRARQRPILNFWNLASLVKTKGLIQNFRFFFPKNLKISKFQTSKFSKFQKYKIAIFQNFK